MWSSIIEASILCASGTLALRAEPGPPTARVTLFALDEANLPR